MALQTVSADGREPLPAVVARHVLALITHRAMKAGDDLPSELQISRELGLSRGTVREAYRTLAALGVLVIENGRRPRLRTVDATVLSQVFGYALDTAQVAPVHVIETRRAIEVQNAQLAARSATEEQRARLRLLADELRESVGDFPRNMVADMAVHTTLAEAGQNPLNALLLNALRAPLVRTMQEDIGPRRSHAELVRIADAHVAIVDRVCAGDAVGAGAAMSYHFDLSFNAMRGAAMQTPAPAAARRN